MEQYSLQNWTALYLGVLFTVTAVQLLMVYVLSDSLSPPRGLGLFTVYFMATLLGWVALAVQSGPGSGLAVDVPSVASILSGYLLFMAVGQRAGVTGGRVLLGGICLAAFLSMFFLVSPALLVVQCASAALFFAVAGAIAARSALRDGNPGDAVIACAGLVMLANLPLVLYLLSGTNGLPRAQLSYFAAHSWAYVLVCMGFLGSVLIEYRQRLSHLNNEDPLTRLLNQRGLQDSLQVSLAQAARDGSPVAAIALDIDHFSKVNDSFGTETGDHLIRAVAEILRRTSRTTDAVARTGGEEFLVILPGASLEAARVAAERLRAAVGDHPILADQQRVAVTVSLGVAVAQGDIDLQDLSREANKALALAKSGGRNRVAAVARQPVHYSSTPEPAPQP